ETGRTYCLLVLVPYRCWRVEQRRVISSVSDHDCNMSRMATDTCFSDPTPAVVKLAVRCPRRFRTANGCRRVLDSHRLVESVACKRQAVDCAMQQLDAAVLDSDCIVRPGLCDHFPRCVVRGKMRKVRVPSRTNACWRSQKRPPLPCGQRLSLHC